ncbi:MAG: DUF4388 domain-containing protein [Deltaproteobacteria bacterium]|nr:DUF4388 domain-containing protein [Deltaproteobacteria bacterium]
MSEAAANLIHIHVLDEDGRVLCMDGQRAFIGALASREVISGQPVQLVLTAQDDPDESFEIVGEVRAKRKTLVLYSGVEFHVAVDHVQRQPKSAPLPSEPFDAQETQQAMQVPGGFSASLLPSPRSAEVLRRTSEFPDDDDWANGALGDSESSGIFGVLSGMSLTELVQSLELNRKTARIDLRPKGHSVGTVFIDEGAVVFAQWSDKLGDDAFTALAQHLRGRFRIQFGQRSEVRNIDRATPWLILEAARLTDETLRDAGSPPPLAAEHAPSNGATGFSDMGQALISVAAAPPASISDEQSADNALFPEISGNDDDIEYALDDAFESVHTRTLSVQEAQELRDRVLDLKSEQGEALSVSSSNGKKGKSQSGKPPAFTGSDPFSDDEQEDATDSSYEGARMRAFHTELTHEGSREDLDATMLLPQQRNPRPEPRPPTKSKKRSSSSNDKKRVKPVVVDDAFMTNPTEVFSAFFDEASPPEGVPKLEKKEKRRKSSKKSKDGTRKKGKRDGSSS